MTRPFDAVFFDFDGVLLDSEPLHCRCWAEVVRPLGIELDWETYRRVGLGFSDWEFCEAIASLAPEPLNPQKLVDLYPQKRQKFHNLALTECLANESQLSFLSSLRPLQLAVVTSCFRAEVEPLLKHLRILDHVDFVITADDVKACKPAPDPYLTAARHIRAVRPLVVEDSAAGVASGKAAGFEVVQVRNATETPAAVRAALARR